jgi:UDP-N-acetylmuramoyl-tripeptide--D-alanyl-D-alanine ligase
MAVIEMGANHLQEIAGYCQYAQPNYGLITNIGKAHIEGFGSAENVKKGKGELFDYLRQHGGTVFLNTADKAVTESATGIDKVVPYGPNSTAFSAHVVKNDPLLQVEFKRSGLVIATQLVGLYNLPNIEAACCIGHYFGVPDDEIKAAIENYKPSNSRSQLVQQGSNTIVLDAYNANPGSMKAAIENFASVPGEKKVLLLGDMKELGNDTQAEHAALVELLDRYTWHAVALVGDYFAAVKSRYAHLPDSVAARQWLQQQQLEHAQILVKGSRSMQMEKVL